MSGRLKEDSGDALPVIIEGIASTPSEIDRQLQRALTGNIVRVTDPCPLGRHLAQSAVGLPVPRYSIRLASDAEPRTALRSRQDSPVSVCSTTCGGLRWRWHRRGGVAAHSGCVLRSQDSATTWNVSNPQGVADTINGDRFTNPDVNSRKELVRLESELPTATHPEQTSTESTWLNRGSRLSSEGQQRRVGVSRKNGGAVALRRRNGWRTMDQKGSGGEWRR